MHPIRNAIIWVVGFFALIILAGKIPKAEVDWRIVDLGAILFWCFAGIMLFIRWAHHFVTRP